MLEALSWVDTEVIHSRSAENWKPPKMQSDTLAFLQYTSGSTSQPKGVMVTHGNLLHNARMMREAFDITDQSSYVCWLPLYHDMGLIGNVVAPVCAGVPSVLMSPLAFLQRPHRWLQAITRYGAEVSGAPNFAYDLCVRKVTGEQKVKLDLSSWRLAFNGSEPVRAETLARFTEAFAECGFRSEALYPCYGLAEATLFVSGGSKSAPPVLRTVDAGNLEHDLVRPNETEGKTRRTVVGCGHAWSGQKILIVDPERMTECPPDEVGEIWVSGPNITCGYWNRVEETKTTFGAFLTDTREGPFLRTGDLGFLKDGELFVTGRLKDLIIIDGRNHYPQDIEETVERSHPAIRRGGCVAFALDADSRERLVIVAEIDRVLLKGPAAAEPGSQNSTMPISQIVRRAVAEHHDLQIHDLRFVEGSILKTSSGKLQHSACKNAFLAGRFEKGADE
jgi:acyl-CoA synthetase (AMP-forming)/AMP-acid ligase II